MSAVGVEGLNDTTSPPTPRTEVAGAVGNHLLMRAIADGYREMNITADSSPQDSQTAQDTVTLPTTVVLGIDSGHSKDTQMSGSIDIEPDEEDERVFKGFLDVCINRGIVLDELTDANRLAASEAMLSTVAYDIKTQNDALRSSGQQPLPAIYNLVQIELAQYRQVYESLSSAELREKFRDAHFEVIGYTGGYRNDYPEILLLEKLGEQIKSRRETAKLAPVRRAVGDLMIAYGMVILSRLRAELAQREAAAEQTDS